MNAALIVGLSGSLRANSSNGALLRAAFALIPGEIETILYDGIGALPHFNPDLDQEGDSPPPPVAQFRALLRRAHGLIVSVPEYAHGLPGAFKNALDWIVSSSDLSQKPVLLLNASAGGNFAQKNLVETLTVIEAKVLAESRLEPFLRTRLQPGVQLSDEETTALRFSVAALVTAATTAATTAAAVSR